MNILVPQGIGDSLWAMVKIQSLAKGEDIDVLIACGNPNNKIECRSLEFIQRFNFVNSARMHKVNIVNSPFATPEGYYNYIPDGPHPDPEIDFVMMPNAPLERGIKLEDWLPEYKANWNIMHEWEFNPSEYDFADKLVEDHGEYAVFFMAANSGNSEKSSGHNRGPLWKPEEWVELGNILHDEQNVKIVVIGSNWDKDYYEQRIQPLLGDDEEFWVNLIGKTTCGEVLSVGRQARFIVAYQGGVAMVPNYMNTPAAIFWRPKGDSIQPSAYVSFEEDMATAWVKPRNLEQDFFMPLIYGRHDVEYIVDEIAKRGW